MRRQILCAFGYPLGIDTGGLADGSERGRQLAAALRHNLRRQSGRDGQHRAGRHAQPVVGVDAGERHQALDDIEPVDKVFALGLVGRLNLAAAGKVTNVPVQVLLCSEEITVERDNSFGLVQMVMRLDRLAADEGGRLAVDVKIHGIIGEPPGLGKSLRNELLKARPRRGSAALEQEAKTIAILFNQLPRQADQEVMRHSRGHDLAGLFEVLGAIGVIQVQDRCLSKTVGRTVAVRVQGVALDFGGPAVVRFDGQGNSSRARRHSRRVILRHAVEVTLGLFGERKDVRDRPTAARQPKARQQKRGGHDLHEMAA